MASAPELLPADVAEVALPPLENGDHLDQKTFHARYEAMPENVKAELIGGRVYVVASPVLIPHGRPHGRLVAWLSNYQTATPGTDVFDNTSTILGGDSEPQPDACLLILPACGGQTREDDDWLTGTPELIVEVASSSESYDLHEKRDDYERYGVREYVVYAVRQRRVYWWVRRGNRYEELSPGADGVFRSETFPGLWLDAAALIQANGGKINDVLRQGLAAPEHAAFVAKLEAARKRS
ncbi:MAG TPA: Uma2 family endonuclease [Gemmataceae bacterium]|jgi:Uma2 family endonuclease